MIELMTASGFAPGLARQILRCLREFTVGHALTLAVLQLGGERRSRKPSPDSPEYNLLDRSADDAGPDDHFDLGRTSMLDKLRPAHRLNAGNHRKTRHRRGWAA